MQSPSPQGQHVSSEPRDRGGFGSLRRPTQPLPGPRSRHDATPVIAACHHEASPVARFVAPRPCPAARQPDTTLPGGQPGRAGRAGRKKAQPRHREHRAVAQRITLYRPGVWCQGWWGAGKEGSKAGVVACANGGGHRATVPVPSATPAAAAKAPSGCRSCGAALRPGGNRHLAGSPVPGPSCGAGDRDAADRRRLPARGAPAAPRREAASR